MTNRRVQSTLHEYVSSTAGPVTITLSLCGRIPLACLFAFSGQGILSTSAFAYSTPAIEMELSISSTGTTKGAGGAIGTTGGWDGVASSQLSGAGGDGEDGKQSADFNQGSPVGLGAAGSAGVLTQTNNGGDGGDGGEGGAGAKKLHLAGGFTGSGGKGGDGGAGADGVQGGKGGNGGAGGKGGANGFTNVVTTVGDQGDGGNGGVAGNGGAGVHGGVGGNGVQGAVGGATLTTSAFTLTADVTGNAGGDGGAGGQGQDGGLGGNGGNGGGLGVLNLSGGYLVTPMDANGGSGGKGGDGGTGGNGGNGGNGADGGNGFEINHGGATVINSTGTTITAGAGGSAGLAGLGGAGGQGGEGGSGATGALEGVHGLDGDKGIAGMVGDAGEDGLAGKGGNGLLISAANATFINLGHVIGANNGGQFTTAGDSAMFCNAVLVAGGNSTLINAGTVTAGADGMAINYLAGADNASLVLQGSSVINGVVNAANVANATLTLGSTATRPTVFDVGLISHTPNNGGQYIGFENFSLNGGGAWTLQGTTVVATHWTVTQGSTLSVTEAANFGPGNNVTLNNGTLSLLGPMHTGQFVTVHADTLENILNVNAMTPSSILNFASTGLDGSVNSLVTVGGGGQLNVLGDSSSYLGNIHIGQATTLQVGEGTTAQLGTGQVTIAEGGLLTFNSAGAVTQAGAINGAGGLAQQGIGMLTLTAENTYTGGTHIAAGSVLAVGEHGVLGTGTIVNNGTLLVANAQSGAGSSVMDQGLAGTGNVAMGDGSIGEMTLTGDNSAFFGLLSVAEGTTLSVQTDVGSGHLLLLGNVVFDNEKEVTMTGGVSGVGSVVVNAPHTLSLSGVNDYTGITLINSGSTLALSMAGSIAHSSAVQLADGAQLSIKDTLDGASVNNLAGQGGSQVVLGDQTLAVHNSTHTIFNGSLVGAGGLTKEGLGTLTLAGQTLQTGTTTLKAGALVLDGGAGGAQLNSDVMGQSGASLLLQNGAVLSGMFAGGVATSGRELQRVPRSGPANLTLTDSAWNLTGDSTVDRLSLTNSQINFIHSANAANPRYSTLSAINIASQNSVIVMHGGSTGSDKIELNGGSFTGHAIIDYTLSSALSQPSITLVEAVNGATTSSDAFSLASPVYFGPNEYVLNQGTANSGYSWSLDKTNSYRPELIVDSSLTSTASGYIDELLSGVHNTLSSKRLGLLLGKSNHDSSVWVTGVGSSTRENPNRYSKTDNNFRATVLGADFVMDLGANNSATVGVFAATGKGQSSYSKRHSKDNTGSSSADTYTLGLYGLGNFDNGFYLDPVLHRSWLKSLNTHYASGLGTKTKASSWGFSVEGGKQIDVGNNIMVAPHVNLDYQQLHMEGIEAHYADITFGRVKNLDVGAGTNISKNIPFDAGRSVSVYARPSIKQRLSSSGDTNYSWRDGAADFATNNNTRGTSFPVTFGVTGHPTKDVAVGVAVDYESSGRSTAVSGTATLSVSF